MSEKINIVVGFDQRESVAYHTFTQSIIEKSSLPVSFIPLAINTLKDYQEIHKDNSNDFVYSRFLTPYLQDFKGWAIFADGDNAPMPSASDSIPTSAIPTTECRPFGGKRFRKAQTRSSNEIVSLKMEKVVTNLDVNGAEKAGEAPENNDELFEQSLEQGRGPRGTKQQRRR
jgi:hypothetical protein